MPDISDIMDVNIEDLSPEQLQQLKDATDQFQQKCLMSFKNNRSGVSYLKNEFKKNRRAVQVNRYNSRTHISPHMESWHLARLEFHLLLPTRLPQLATDCRRICTVDATTK
jgi:hypothetical protein